MPYSDRERQRAYQREWVGRRRAEFFNGKTCDDCGGSEDLELHHRHPATKVSHRIWGWSEARLAAELAKCVVLCRSCHQALHAGESATLDAVCFSVFGEPTPQGSKTRTRWGVREDNPKTRPWRAAVAAEPASALDGLDLLAGPLELDVSFFFARPKSHYGTGRNAGRLRPSAPAWKTSAPDTDKLVRACLDAMSGAVFRDASGVVVVNARKLYGSPARAEVVVRPASEVDSW